MAGQSTFLEPFEKLPIWQRLAMMVAGGIVIGLGWWFLYYQPAIEARSSAQDSLAQTQRELEDYRKKQEAFEERRRQLQDLDAQLQAKMNVLPGSIASVDNLMQTFQQQARLVGLSVNSWSPSGESLDEYYARLPIKVTGEGAWSQLGEFFRRISELERIVSIDNLSLSGTTKEPNLSPRLSFSFEAATYRFLEESERASSKSSKKRKGSRRRKP